MDLLANTQRLYNTPVEVAVRILILLDEAGEMRMDTTKIMVLDHLALYTEDVGGDNSLHAPIPNRPVQAFAKSEVVQKGLAILTSKELAFVEVSKEQGFLYYASDLSSKFLEYFDSEYFFELREKIKWVLVRFGLLSSEELEELIMGELRSTL